MSNAGERNGSVNGRRRVGAFPLVVYVALLIAIPLVAMTILGLREVRRDIAAADDARAVAETIEDQTTAIEVLAPLQIERIVALGTARLEELGIDTQSDVINPVTATQLGLIMSGNTERLDARLDAFAEVLDEADMEDLEAELEASRADMEVVRAELDAGEASYQDVEQIYESVLAVIDEFLSTTTVVFAESQPSAFDAERLILEHTLAGLLLRTASDEVSEMADVFVGIDEFEMAELLSAASRHEDTLEQMLAVTDNTEGVVELVQARQELNPFLDGWLENGATTAELVALEPQLYNAYLTVLTERLIYLLDVEQFTEDIGEEIVGFSTGVADDADSAKRNTVIALLVVGFGVLILVVILTRSFARPLKRLQTQAKRIGDGDLAMDEIPVAGPTDIRRVTSAVNEMAGTLHAVDGYLKVLAAGGVPAVDTPVELPGPVGTSLRESIQHVGDLTTELKQSEERLQIEARHDGLTSLLNRFGVIEQLGERLSSGEERFSVLIIDLDGFKNVNDTNGQAIGDDVLREVAERLVEQSDPDDLISRFGGDEFLVVANSCGDEQQALELGRRLIVAIEQPFRVGALRLALSASVGATTVTGESSALGVVEQAEAAVYHAKERGRGRVETYDADLQASIEQAAEIELALKRAIEEGELRLFLQPTADIRSGAVDGAEALVRWERPGEGMVSPAGFIPIAERSGLIIEVDRWVLEACCRRIVDWKARDPGTRLRLALNISGRHLTEGDLVADLDAALAATGADPSMLEIELTESHLLDDVDRIVGILNAIRDRGVAISVDDFGTGYSSMTYLQRFPLDAVKIDRSFVARAPAHGFDSKVIDSIVRLAAALELDVVAEGIETFEQLQLARDMGVDRAQGYLLARPMPIDEAEQILFGGPLIDVADLDAAADREQG